MQFKAWSLCRITKRRFLTSFIALPNGTRRLRLRERTIPRKTSVWKCFGQITIRAKSNPTASYPMENCSPLLEASRKRAQKNLGHSFIHDEESDARIISVV